MATKILVIDDHPDTMQLIELSLQRQGYSVLGARNGREGIHLAITEQPHLILLDIMMPDMDGYEVCRLIRQQESLADVPVIMFSAKGEPAEKLAGFDAGANDFLTKPTRPSELVERVQLLLNRHGDQPEDPSSNLPVPRPNQLLVLLGARGGAGTTIAAINIAACLASMDNDTILADLDLAQGHIAGYLNQPVLKNIGHLFETPLQEWPPAIEDYLLRRNKHWQLLLTHPHLHESPAVSEQAVDRLVDMLDATGKTTIMDLGIQFGPQMLPSVRRADQVLLCLRPEKVAIDAARRLIPYLRDQRPVEESLHVIMLDFRVGAGLPRSAVENYIKYPLFDVLHIYGADLADAVNAGKSLVEMHPFAPISYHFQALAGRLGVVEQKV